MSANNIALSFRAPWILLPPEFSCLPVAGLSYRMASTVHQTRDQERNSPSHRASSLPAHSLASVLRRLEHPIRSPFIENFLLRQIPSCFSSGPRIYTGLLVLPEHRCYIYPSPLSWKCSLLPAKGSWTSPQMLSPMSESPSGKREVFQDNATRKKREVYCWLESGLPPRVQRSGTRSESAEPKLLPNL